MDKKVTFYRRIALFFEPMKIRPIRESEAKEAARIVALNYSGEYEEFAEEEIRAMFHNPTIPPHYLVAEEDGKIVGFAGYSQAWMDYTVYQIYWVNVAPENQNKGIGTKLVDRVIQEIKKSRERDKEPLVIQLTTSSPDFYSKRFGFKTLTTFNQNKYHLMALSLER